ncbi:MAG: LamG-like jellyroll fold domain-containing protein [Cyanobacteria bacterium P01_G01_bin.19]
MNLVASNSNNQNLVLQSTGVGVNIQDLSLLGDFTLEFRLYFEPDREINNEDGIVSSGTFGNGSDVSFEEGKLQLYSSSHGGNGVVVRSNTTAEAGKWNHYAIVRENGITKIYLNGEVDGTSTQSWTNSFEISEIAQSLNGGLEGQLDELRIWQVARNTTEIQNNMELSVPNDSAGLERYYRFDDPGHIIDATGNAETGHDLHLPIGVSIVNAAEEASTGEFIDTQVVDGLFLPTDMAFLPDGRMLVIEKGGTIQIVADPTQPNSSIETYMDMSDFVLDSEERGLLAIEVDPNFETNGYFYLFYTNDLEQRTTVSRFQHQENGGGTSSRAAYSSETVLWQEFDVTSSCCHQGGGLAIAHEPIDENDPSPYKIYITVGEEFDGIKSQDLGHDDGKVHRINLSDGSIPVDNPYYDASTATNYTPTIDTSSAISSDGIIQTIYSYGLRNPFRASYDQESNSLFIGEVGGNNNNTAREDIHIAAAGANHGWPNHEGFFGSSDDPGNPIHSYPHLNGPGQGEIPLFGANGASVSGGLVYRGDDFPEQYQGAYFYGDWVRNWIRYLELDYSNGRPELVADHSFKNTTGQVLSFEQGPDGSLYYLTTFQTGNVFTFQGAVNRLEWSQDNSAPQGAGIVLDNNELFSATAPHTVTFEVDASDPDGDELTYQWSFGDGIDFDGDGIGDTATSTDPNPTYTYQAKGEYIVELIVTDSNGAATVFDSQTIVVGQKPTVNITSPADGYLFRAGETLTFTGTASDPEDGVLSGDSVVWSAVFLHNEHNHPGISGVANQVGGVTFKIEDSGHDYSSDTGYEIFLTATDSDGISTTESVIVRPDKVDITFDAPRETNYQFLLDGLSYQGDYTHDTIINFQHTIEAQASYVDNGLEYNFSHWEDDINNQDPVRNFIVPDTDTTFRPVYTIGATISDAIALDGTESVSVPNLVVGKDGGDFTIETWVKLAPGDAIDNKDGLVSSGVFGNGNDINFYNGKIRLYSSDSGDIVIANDEISSDVWAHYAIVREQGVMKIYKDGQLEVAKNTNWAGTFVIDDIGGAIVGSLNGELDEFRIWTLARSEADIDANKDFRINGATPGLERYYQFDGGIVDITGNSSQIELPASAQLVNSTAPIQSTSANNISPIAVDDTATIDEGTTKHLHILDNDYDPDGSINPQVVEILSSPSHGTLEMIDTQAELDARGLGMHHFGHAEYTPNPGFTGVDSFVYRVQDNEGAWSNPATLTVTVEPTNNIPVALDDDATTNENQSVIIDVLANDSDLDGDFLLILEACATNGSVTINSDRTLTYTPDTDYVGEDWISYRISDGNGGEATATVNLTVEEVTTPSLGRAISLDGTGGIDVEDLTLNGDFTIEAWVKFAENTAITNQDGIVVSGVFGNGNDLNFYRGKARIYSSSYEFDNDPVIAKKRSTNAQWQHYAFVRENGVASVYLDGVLSSTSNHSWNGEFDIDQIGRGIAGGLEGELDELRIWSVARTQSEISDNLGTEIDPDILDLERYYQFDEGVIDATGNSADAELPSYVQLVDSTAPIDNLDLNVASIATDDRFIVLEDSINFLRILDNDFDSDGSLNPLEIEILTQPVHGSLEILDTQAELDARNRSVNSFGRAEYIAPEGFSGTDVFTYRVQDNDGDWSNPATVTIDVELQSSFNTVSNNSIQAFSTDDGIASDALTLELEDMVGEDDILS